MKKLTLSILGMMLAFVGFAKEVSVNEASDIALRLMAEKGVNAQSVVSVTPVDYQGSTAFYGVSFAPEGWALISADDVITPLVGYSDKAAFPAADMPSNMRGWLNLNAEQILDYKKEVNTRSTDWDKNKISRSSAPSMALTDKISPLIKVQWNQTNPYNKYCPSNSSAGRAVVGCVAVAMAQAMSVVKYPARPQGADTYGQPSD